MKFIKKYWYEILIFFLIFFLLGTGVLIYYGSAKAETYNSNILVEIFIGGLMLMAPIIISLSIGKWITKNLFYNDIETVIRKIKEERASKNITEEGARSMVKIVSSTFGRDILEDPLLTRLPRSTDPILHENIKCGVCGLDAQLAINNHCVNCKLDCFLWKGMITKK